MRLIAWSYSVSSSSVSLAPSGDAAPRSSDDEVDRGCEFFWPTTTAAAAAAGIAGSLGSLRRSSSTSKSLPAIELVDLFSSDVVLLLVFMLRSIGLSWCTELEVDEADEEAGDTSAPLRSLISVVTALGVELSF